MKRAGGDWAILLNAFEKIILTKSVTRERLERRGGSCVRTEGGGPFIHSHTHMWFSRGNGASSTEPHQAKAQIGAARVAGGTDAERLNDANSVFDFNRRQAKPSTACFPLRGTKNHSLRSWFTENDFNWRPFEQLTTRRFIMVKSVFVISYVWGYICVEIYSTYSCCHSLKVVWLVLD